MTAPAENPRKVLYIDTALSVWGGQRSLFEILERLDDRRYTPAVAVPAGSRTAALYRELAAVYTFPAHSAAEGYPVNPLSVLRSVPIISGIIKEVKPDIVHANTFLAALLVSLVPFLRTPWILHQRDFKDHGFLSRRAARRATKVIAITKATAARYAGYKLKRPIAVITQGVDLSFTRRLADERSNPTLKAGLGLKNCETLVGAVGTISTQKSQGELLEAAALLRDIPDLFFACIGAPFRTEDKAYLGSLINRRAELNLEDRLFFAEFIEDRAVIYGSIDVLAHPARREGLGRVVLEAMGAGVPVVARGDCGPAEVIENGVDGVLFEPNNFEDFVDKLRRLVEDKDFRRSVSASGRKKVAEEFTIEKSTARLQEVYDELLAGR